MANYDAIPGLMGAIRPLSMMEFLVGNRDRLKMLKPGQDIVASVRK